MGQSAYTDFTIDENYEVFEFVSVGKQSLNKIVKFRLVGEREQIYNLVLCTILSDSRQDCESPSRNGDMDAVLATCAKIAKIFSDHYPQRKIFLTGSTLPRTRQYQIKIAVFYELISHYFDIEGVMIDDFVITKREKFKSGVNYDGFILTRKT